MILAPASGPAVAAKRATATIPIVSPALADAVHLGLVASVSRPGGNVTGITPYVEGLPAKQMELAREVVPRAARIGVLANVSDPKAPPQLQELEAAGRELGVTVVVADAPTPDDVDGALQMLAYHRIEVMVVLQTSMLLSERQRIASLAATTRLPAVYGPIAAIAASEALRRARLANENPARVSQSKGGLPGRGLGNPRVRILGQLLEGSA